MKLTSIVLDQLEDLNSILLSIDLRVGIDDKFIWFNNLDGEICGERRLFGMFKAGKL